MKYTMVCEINTNEKKNLLKAIRCSFLLASPIGDGWYKVDLIEKTESDLEKAVNDNFDILAALMD